MGATNKVGVDDCIGKSDTEFHEIEADMGVPNLPSAAVTLAMYNPKMIRESKEFADNGLADLVVLARRYLTAVFEWELFKFSDDNEVAD